MRIGTQEFDTKNHTYVMGILNVTPDSFSDGGRYNQLDAALFHAEAMLREGAAILDVGGESTRPGYAPVPAEEEIRRVVPVIRALTRRFEAPVSVDTWKSSVAEAAVQAGASMINDIWGLKGDPQMARVAAESGAACCLMHNRKEAVYEDFMREVAADLMASVEIAREAGVGDDRLILDPGVGFAKSYVQNLEVIARLEELVHLGFPVLLGTSRKSVIGKTLDLPADQRLEGTLVTTVYAVQKGCAFVRVHDVKENLRAIQMTKALMRG